MESENKMNPRVRQGNNEDAKVGQRVIKTTFAGRQIVYEVTEVLNKEFGIFNVVAKLVDGSEDDKPILKRAITLFDVEDLAK